MHRTQNPVKLTLRVGSTPTSGTITFNNFNRSGAVTLMQRFGGALNINFHYFSSATNCQRTASAMTRLPDVSSDTSSRVSPWER